MTQDMGAQSLLQPLLDVVRRTRAQVSLIPTALDFDLCPGAAGDGGDLLWPTHQRVPGRAAGVHDGVVALPHAVTEEVGPQELPQVLERAQFGCIAGQR